MQLAVSNLKIPFKTVFRHAAAERRKTASVWVTAQRGGVRGHGEGCPRAYVSGESTRSALAFFDRVRHEVIDQVRDVAQLRAWVGARRKLIDANPAAWCAIELALLDLFAREQNCSVEELLGLPALAPEFRYTAVLGDAPPDAFVAQLDRYRELGFEDFKIKLSGNAERDLAKIEALSRVPGLRVRLDANNLWQCERSALRHLRLLGRSYFAVEEPIAIGRYAGLAALADALQTRIILDESLLRVAQLGELAGQQRWLLNLRVSKMGGLIRALEVAAAACASEIGIIAGCHVGETALLARAALTVTNAFRGVVIAQEGAFGTWLLETDACRPSFRFGAGGRLHPARLLTGHTGFGLDVSIPPACLGAA